MCSSGSSSNLACSISNGKLVLCREGKPILLGQLTPADGYSFESNAPFIQLHEAGHRINIQIPCPVFFRFKLLDTWFGYGELLHQKPSLNEIMLPFDAFLTYDNGPSGQSSILEPVFFSSSGIALEIPGLASVGINQPPADYPRYGWSFGQEKGPFAQRPFSDDGNGDGEFTCCIQPGSITIRVTDTLQQAAKAYLSRLPHPGRIPPERLFQLPTWTTWARYKTEVNQQVVLQFASEIQAHGYPYGVMEIDDRWQTRYGDLVFDPTRFPDPAAMVADLHQRGFEVTCWVIPFLDPESQAGKDGSRSGYVIRNRHGDPYMVPWWQGSGYLLDVTNDRALEWFKNRLLALRKETGLDGYKFDAGEGCFLPADAVTNDPITRNEYAHRYVDFIGQNFCLTEVRSGWHNQQSPIFFRQWDKWSTWGADNGLKSVLTGILSLGLVGYPFVLPDMVGGNAYDEQPDSELMIRWAALNALLPAMQFSLAPWDFGEECDRLCKKFAELHLRFSPVILEAAREAASSGIPIIRPIWWNSPNDPQALQCGDEFLLGDHYLVAPVLEKGVNKREVYLPEGDWEDYWSKQRHTGNQRLIVPADLDQLPVYQKVN